MGVGTTIFLTAWNSSRTRQAHERNTELALQQAKEEVVGKAISPSNITLAGYLPLPDLGTLIGSPKEGYETGSFSGNSKNYSVIGKLPWRSLGVMPLRDQQGECLWYIVSGRFKNSPKSDTFNWDTQGQIDIIDGNGVVIASNIAAMIVAPGSPLDGQNRISVDAAYTQCGGNYLAANYLDAHDAANAVAGQVNYFIGSINNRVAVDENNKQFVMTNNPHYNDRFLPITSDDIFRLIIRRSDFSAQISNLLDNPVFQAHLNSIVIAGAKGTDNLNCEAMPNADSKLFCKNWKEMLFLTQLATPSPITINGLPSPVCNRVAIFAGRKIVGQSRTTSTEKENKSNYLEEPNLSAFAIPTAHSSGFNGISAFTLHQPGADITRCISGVYP